MISSLNSVPKFLVKGENGLRSFLDMQVFKKIYFLQSVDSQ